MLIKKKFWSNYKSDVFLKTFIDSRVHSSTLTSKVKLNYYSSILSQLGSIECTYTVIKLYFDRCGIFYLSLILLYYGSYLKGDDYLLVRPSESIIQNI